MQEALRQVAEALAGVSDEPIRVGSIELQLGIPLQRVIDGYVTEKVAASEVARKLLDAVTAEMPAPVAEHVKQRRAYLLFGRHLPDRPKTLRQLLAERLLDSDHPDPTKGTWMQRALDQIVKLGAEYQPRLDARDAAIAMWVFDQGPDPQDNPVAKANLADAYKGVARKAQKEIKAIHKESSSASEFFQKLYVRGDELLAKGGDDHKVGRLLRHYLQEMSDRAKPVVYDQDPSLAEVDQQWVAARLLMASTPTALPYVKLPAGVPPLGEMPESVASHYRTKSAEALAIAEQTIAMARAGGADDPSGQYYFVQMRQATYQRSQDPKVVMASIILARYLREQKQPWAREHIEEVLKHKPSRKPSWNLTDDVAYVGENKETLPADHRQVKKVQKAWDKILEIMSPEVLDRIGPCKVRIHRSPFFRAHYSGGKREIHVQSLESLPVIMHEFGHHVEDQGGLQPWLRVQRLLHERAQSDKLKSISFITPNELRYDSGIDGGHPIGSYGARYYSYGSTEIMSMGMQLFANPRHATALFMKDPEMFYTVLSAFRPEGL